MSSLRMLAFGGCNIRIPLFRASCGHSPLDEQVSWADVPSELRVIGPPFMTYTVGEMLQVLSGWRGHFQIPVELHELCHMTDRIAPTPGNSPLDRCDMALLEPNTSVEIEFEGCSLNRWPVLRFLAPVGKLSPRAKKMCSLWFKKGILALDDEAKRETAEQLLLLVPEDTPNREFLSAFLRGATGSRRNVREGLCRVADSLDVPCGVVAFTWAYMPDGRALSWPDGFHEEVVGAAHDLGLPLFEPRPFVEKAGLAFALKDLRHYAEEFMPTIAKPLVEFARSVASDGAKSRQYQ